MPTRKETDFFSGPPNGLPYATGYKRVATLAEYERLFDPSVLARGEASPNYTVYPLRRGTAERLHAVLPDAKLIYLVRDPVARTISHYHHRVSVENERRSLQEALADAGEASCFYTAASMYAMQLEQYLEFFSQEQIMIVDQAELRQSRTQLLRSIFTFLSVDDTFVSPRFEEEINTGGERRTYSDFIVWVRRAQATPARHLPRSVRVALRRAGERLTTRPLEPPVLDESMRERLSAIYADDAERLRALTGLRLATWSV